MKLIRKLARLKLAWLAGQLSMQWQQWPAWPSSMSAPAPAMAGGWPAQPSVAKAAIQPSWRLASISLRPWRLAAGAGGWHPAAAHRLAQWRGLAVLCVIEVNHCAATD